MRYTSEIGALARADDLGALTLAAAYGLQLENCMACASRLSRTNSTSLRRRTRVGWPPCSTSKSA
jgi:hypothetical protein